MPNLFFNHDERFDRKIKNFPDTLYRINDPTSKIYRLLYALLEIGVGQAKGMQDNAIISQNSLASTTGQQLDQYFQIFGIKRTPSYFSDVQDQSVGDSKFRVAISKFLQAISLGGTSEGIRLMSEASTGFKCYVVEPWRNPENAEGIARLKDGSDQPLGNEVIVFVFPHRPLADDEENSLRVRVIENCKIIAPLHTTITVNIQVVENSLEFVPSYVTSDSFSFIQNSSDPDLLSQEAEISFNNLVTHINTFQIDDEYTIPVGSLGSALTSSSTTLQISEDKTPLTTPFFVKLVEGNAEEIVLVKNREFLNSPNTFSYEIERAQKNTVASSFSSGVTVLSNLIAIYSESKNVEIVFDNWLPIPTADSPDNYPTGKYPNDPRRYDSNGEYLFEWSSQASFVSWFTDYINQIGGEIKGNQYRLVVNERVSSESILQSNIINQIMGPSYNFVRPIPKPRD